MWATLKTCLRSASALPIVVALGLGVSGPAKAARVNVDLCARAGTVEMPGGTVVNIWGFAPSIVSGTPAGEDDCGPAQLPGPPLGLAPADAITVGDTVVVTLFNALTENVSIISPGLDLSAGLFDLPDMLGAAPGETVGFSFVAARPGTFSYESGVNPSIQVPMGLYGALVVRPENPGQAYGPDSAFDAEALLVLSEIDADLSADPSTFDLTNYKPDFWLINGKAYPDTDPIPAGAGERLLLRYVNAGFEHHTMALLSLHQSLIARDAYPLQFPFDVVGETIASGQTLDAIATIPGGALSGDEFALRSRQLRLTNGPPSNTAHIPGGMLAFIEVP